MPTLLQFWNGLCIFVAGASVGWLVGMSSSPVVQGVISAIGGAVAAIASLNFGNSPQSEKVNASPSLVAFLTLGLAIGAGLGIYCRSHNVFGASLASQKAQLTDVGLSEEEAHSLIIARVASDMSSEVDNVVRRSSLGSLFSAKPTAECDVYRGKSGAELVSLMKASSDPQISEFAERCKDDPECLQAFVEVVLCAP